MFTIDVKKVLKAGMICADETKNRGRLQGWRPLNTQMAGQTLSGLWG